MKKALIFMLIALACTLSILCLSACGSDDSTTTTACEHVAEILPSKAHSCTEDGLTEGKKCSLCGELLAEQKVIPASHSFINFNTCKVCGLKASISLNYVLSEDGKSYIVKDRGICRDADLYIPEYYKGLPVTSICKTESSYTSLGNFKSIHIPSTVTTIAKSVYEDDTNTVSFTVDENNPVYKSIDGNLYSKDGKTLVRYAHKKADKQFTIPDGVTSIGDYAFYKCASLTEIIIPDSVKDIGFNAFNGCTGLTSITIPNSVTSIGKYAFGSCPKLAEVYNLSSLDASTHFGSRIIHTSLEEKSALETVNGYVFLTLENDYYLMGYVGNDIELTLPESYNGNEYSIYNYAFYYNTDITRVVIPDSVISIGSAAFQDCLNLVSVTIGNGVTVIGSRAFSYCSSLASVTFENTSDWYVIYSATSANGTKVDVTNDAINAGNLRGIYKQYRWEINPF